MKVLEIRGLGLGTVVAIRCGHFPGIMPVGGRAEGSLIPFHRAAEVDWPFSTEQGGYGSVC